MSASISPVSSSVPPALAGEHRGEQRNTSVEQEVLYSPERVAAIVSELNRSVSVINSRVSFSIDQGTNKVVIRVIDGDTNEVIRQIPPEEMLRVSARIKELLGVLFDKTL